MKRILGRLQHMVIALALLPASSMAENGVDIPPVDCVIEPNATIEVGSAAEGILRNVTVKRGDQVKKGDLLAELDGELERLTSELAKLRAEIDVEVRSGLAQLQFRKRETKRLVDLKSRNAIPETELDKARVEERLARLSVESARAEQEIAKVEYERAKEQLQRRSIYSPRDGIVADVKLFPGEYVHEQSPLMTVAAIDPLHVEVFVPVVHFGKIATGMQATVMPEAPIGGEYAAEVTVVDQVFDAASRTFGVRLEMANGDYALPGGLRCTVQFEAESDIQEVDFAPLSSR